MVVVNSPRELPNIHLRFYHVGSIEEAEQIEAKQNPFYKTYYYETPTLKHRYVYIVPMGE